MNVKELVNRLRHAPGGATVLCLQTHRKVDECDMVRGVLVPPQPWVHERLRRADGHVDHRFLQRLDERSEGFNEVTDEASLERVVILVSNAKSLEHTPEEPARTGRTLSMEVVRAKEAQRYRDMLSNGELLREEVFRTRLGVSEKRLSKMVEKGHVFALDVDGDKVFPALLCDASLKLKRLWKVTQTLVPAPATLRLDLLTGQCGALSDRAPLDLLGDDKAYRELLRFARAWASEFSRTVVKVYDATGPVDKSNDVPLYSCAAEMDPRVRIWKRAMKAVRSPGYQMPHEVPESPATVVVIVERATAGQSGAEVEAHLVCDVDGRTLRVTVTPAGDASVIEHKLKLALKRPNLTDLCDAVFKALSTLE
ncbi:hypothetical protein P9239_19300 [Caballeronia sp. LZ062]|uniref:hypothetical protein n=1 Tax=unclassified Caballeronia TaxID=2646786 RepID=UPI00286407F1|nr:MULTISPECIES: hypothetical protein [unclassified Caballeronia]MDR5855714.1 hypothetical protein [Caballeronia sp. LZ050]MDR5872499.1 hypothetical protein [Caballeronia sp. LZ062]